MKGKYLFVALAVLAITRAYGATPGDEKVLLEVRLRDLPIPSDFYIEAVSLHVEAGYVRHVSIPMDWSMEVGPCDLTHGTRVSGQAGHGVSRLKNSEKFGALITISCDRPWHRRNPCTDQLIVRGEVRVSSPDETRTIQIPEDCIELLEVPDRQQDAQ